MCAVMMSSRVFQLRQGQSCVITGGAGGIGRASAEMWLAQGGSVVIADVDDVAGRDFVQKQQPGRAEFVHCDARRQEHLKASIATARRLGRFTCMFNNAGVGAECDNLSEALDKWGTLARMIHINVNACCLGAYLALDAFRTDGTEKGVVITTASMAGLLPVGAPPIYSMTKAANIQFTRSIAAQLGGDASSTRIYALCPSYTATGLGPDPEVIKAALGGVLMPSHMAEGFMLLSEATLPNGSVMRVTVRRGGTHVVHDLVTYGKELGGRAKPRPGVVVKESTLDEYQGPAHKVKPSFGNEMLRLGKL